MPSLSKNHGVIKTAVFSHCFPEKKNQQLKFLLSCWFSRWTSLGLNQGPPDYESVALTNWATSPTERKNDTFGTLGNLGCLFPWVVLPGFEPGMTEPKPVVLPLHHSTILIEAFGEERQGKTRWRGSSFAECGCKVRAFFWISQKLLWKNVEKFHFVCVF